MKIFISSKFVKFFSCSKFEKFLFCSKFVKFNFLYRDTVLRRKAFVTLALPAQSTKPIHANSATIPRPVQPFRSFILRPQYSATILHSQCFHEATPCPIEEQHPGDTDSDHCCGKALVTSTLPRYKSYLISSAHCLLMRLYNCCNGCHDVSSADIVNYKAF